MRQDWSMTDLPAYLRPFVLGVLEGSDVRVDRLGEIDRAAWFDLATARTKMIAGQHALLDRLLEHVL